MNDFAKRLRELRGEVSREEFAKLIGVTPRTLINYEQGERLPKIDVIKLICSQLDVSSDWLISGKGKIPKTANGKQQNKNLILQPSENIENEHTETANVSNSFSPATDMLRQEVESLNQEIARLFADKREVSKELREALLELDHRAAQIEQLVRQNKELAAENAALQGRESEAFNKGTCPDAARPEGGRAVG